MKKLTEELLNDIRKGKISISTWMSICWDYKLSEDFIEEYQNNLSWYRISSRQKLSEEFLIKHQDKILWNTFFYNQNLNQYSKQVQRIVLEKIIDYHKNESYFFQSGFMTDYMIELYNKLSIML
jgi:hypothetical protein